MIDLGNDLPMERLYGQQSYCYGDEPGHGLDALVEKMVANLETALKLDLQFEEVEMQKDLSFLLLQTNSKQRISY